MSGVMRAHHKEVLGIRCWLEEVGYGVMVMLVPVECGRIGGCMLGWTCDGLLECEDKLMI